MKMLTIVNKMAAGMETDINATNVIMLNVTVRTVCDAGIPCCNKQNGIHKPHYIRSVSAYAKMNLQISCKVTKLTKQAFS